MTKPYETTFTMDSMDDDVFIKGITYGYTWNGWACPYFTKESVLQIAKEMPDFGIQYDANQDMFFGESEYYDREEWQSKIINGQKYYPIGNCSWCWYELTKEDLNHE